MLKEITKNLKLNDFLKNHIVTNLKVGRDNTFALYFDITLDPESNVYHKNVILLDLNSFQLSQLDLPFEPDDFVVNNSEIIFKVIKNGSTTFYLYVHSDKKLTNLNSIPFEARIFAVNEDKIYFTAVVQEQDYNENIKCSQRGPFYLEGCRGVGNGVTGLFQSNHDGKDITLISSLDMDLDQLDFDFVNNRIVFSAYKKENVKPVSSAVYLYDIEKESMKVLFNKNYRISNVQSINENLVVFTGVDLDKHSRNDNQQIYQINLYTGLTKVLGKFQNKSNEHPGVVTDSFFSSSQSIQKFKEDFYFKLVEADRDMIYRINMDGDCKSIETGMKNIGSFCVTEKGIILAGLKSLKLSELYFFSKEKNKQITHHNAWLDHISLSKSETVSCTIDKVEIEGYVFPPVNIQKDSSYPAVLMIHGGPKKIYSDVFSHDIQLLCANGYYVLCANPMGSDGRGDDFSNIRGHFGDLPYRQLMGFTDKVLKIFPQIDENSLGVSGGSYGGYMTNFIITQTSRFKAAVSERGISNLMTAFTSSDIGYQYIFEYLGNEITPWTDPVITMEASPIYQAHRATTPTLFIHGKNDHRCHYTESLNMFSALNYHGIETRMCLFDKENHSLVVRGKPQSKIRRYKEFISWFDRFLKRGLS